MVFLEKMHYKVKLSLVNKYRREDKGILNEKITKKVYLKEYIDNRYKESLDEGWKY